MNKLNILRIKIKKFWICHLYGIGKYLLCAAAVAGLMILLAVIAAPKEYYYIDYNGDEGVAKNCQMVAAGLVCEKMYGGKIMVKEYSEIRR